MTPQREKIPRSAETTSEKFAERTEESEEADGADQPGLALCRQWQKEGVTGGTSEEEWSTGRRGAERPLSSLLVVSPDRAARQVVVPVLLIR